ncbi:MAG: hypothetical protein KAU62_10855 [Candidatus Heimdallarchaeota archaeon]|nr:hypothetical protein [Candidatus Heimdallarchaeota archaeon]MCK4611644.1 hypothetical protein [Candidatus Heimdallarchaeota archaeon]
MRRMIKMNKSKRISNNTLIVIIGLATSVMWIFMGLDFGFAFGPLDMVCEILTLGGYRHTIMTLLALILIPLCAIENKWGLLGAMVLGILIVTLSMTHVIYMLIASPTGYEKQLFGPIAWSIIQIPIVVFSAKSRKEVINTPT